MVVWLQSREGSSGIVYCGRRETTDSVAKALQDAGVDAGAYHAGKDARTRAAVQRDWSEGALEVVVATIAFGMGIDMPACRFVVHYTISTSMEGLLQVGAVSVVTRAARPTGNWSSGAGWLALCGTRLLQVKDVLYV